MWRSTLALAAAGLLTLVTYHMGTAGATASAKPALYTVQQSSDGEKTFEDKCSMCHGEHLEGGAGPALSGSTLATLAKHTKLTIGDMFTYFSQQMPMNAPASLTHKQYTDIMAFILKKNGYPAGKKALTYSGAMASTVRITPAGQ